MNKWKTYKLGDLGSFLGGVTSIKKEDYGFGTPFLTYKNVYKNSKVNVKELELMNVKSQDIERRSAVYGDVFFTASSETPDEVAMSSVLLNNVPDLTFNGFCKRYRLNNFDTLLPEYARYLFRDNSFRKEVYQIATGDIRFNVSQESLTNIKINIPDLSTQRQITSILSSLDDKIELNLQMNQTLEAMAQVVFREWFVDFNFPGTDRELVDGLPRGWKERTLKDCGKIICGKTPSKAVDEYFGGEDMCIKIPDMHNSIFIIETTDSLTELGLNSQVSKSIPPYSICVSSIATVGLVCINSKTCQTNQQINTIVPQNEFLKYYLYFLAISMKETFLAIASGGTATLNMNTSQFSDIEVIIPNDELLKKFDTIVSPMMVKILENTYNNQSLIQARDSLLPRLMSGKIKIENIKSI
jgi:type I restriction enzyme S subunit